jgi:hypothetical protein
MNVLLTYVRKLLHSRVSKRVVFIWPFSAVSRKLDCAYETATARILLRNISILEEQTVGEKYADATDHVLLKHRRNLKVLLRGVQAAICKNRAGTLSPTHEFQARYGLMHAQIMRILDQDSGWRSWAKHLGQARTELWLEATRWALAWQKTITGFVREVDEALRFARRTRTPDNQLNDASLAVKHLHTALQYVQEVSNLHKTASAQARRVDPLRPLKESYLYEDKLNFRATFDAGCESFKAGDYSAARRYLEAALRQSKRIVAGERLERWRHKRDANEWIKTLSSRDPETRILSVEINAVLEIASAPEFHAEWEDLHKQIGDHVVARAYAMGNRDQKTIAQRIGDKQTFRWRDTIQWEDLSRFAEAVAKEL